MLNQNSVLLAVKTLPQLQQGDSGDAVILMQKLLRYLGKKLAVTGSFNDETRNRVTEFQRTNRLVADGVVGDRTWSELIRQFNPPQVG